MDQLGESVNTTKLGDGLALPVELIVMVNFNTGIIQHGEEFAAIGAPKFKRVEFEFHAFKTDKRVLEMEWTYTLV